MVDRVRPLKIEDSGTGSESDQFPTEANPHEDYLDARGVTLQDTTSSDSNVRVEREAATNRLKFFDGDFPGGKTLGDLGSTGITESSHKTLLQLIHFIDEGPAEGFVTGATKTVTGTVFPTQVLWRRADSTKLVEKNITWTGITPTTVQWKVYDTDGSTVLATVTDTLTYSGVFETGRSRAVV